MLLVRPRGWHLLEKHVLMDGQPISGALFDFGLFFFHNAKDLLAQRQRPVLLPAQAGEPPGSAAVERRLRHVAGRCWASRAAPSSATVLIETILAAFEMDEILYELREHSRGPQLRALGLHLQLHQEVPRPQRGCVARPRAGDHDLARSCARTRCWLIKTCHRRNVPRDGRHGGAVSPSSNDPEANQRAIAQVQADKEREATDGHDGTWVAHPGLVPVALEVFNADYAAAEPDRSRSARMCRCHAADLMPVRRGADHRGGAAHQHQRRHPISRGLAGRPGLPCRSST